MIFLMLLSATQLPNGICKTCIQCLSTFAKQLISPNTSVTHVESLEENKLKQAYLEIKKIYLMEIQQFEDFYETVKSYQTGSKKEVEAYYGKNHADVSAYRIAAMNTRNRMVNKRGQFERQIKATLGNLNPDQMFGLLSTHIFDATDFLFQEFKRTYEIKLEIQNNGRSDKACYLMYKANEKPYFQTVAKLFENTWDNYIKKISILYNCIDSSYCENEKTLRYFIEHAKSTYDEKLREWEIQSIPENLPFTNHDVFCLIASNPIINFIIRDNSVDFETALEKFSRTIARGAKQVELTPPQTPKKGYRQQRNPNRSKLKNVKPILPEVYNIFSPETPIAPSNKLILEGDTKLGKLLIHTHDVLAKKANKRKQVLELTHEEKIAFMNNIIRQREEKQQQRKENIEKKVQQEKLLTEKVANVKKQYESAGSENIAVQTDELFDAVLMNMKPDALQRMYENFRLQNRIKSTKMSKREVVKNDSKRKAELSISNKTSSSSSSDMTSEQIVPEKERLNIQSVEDISDKYKKKMVDAIIAFNNLKNPTADDFEKALNGFNTEQFTIGTMSKSSGSTHRNIVIQQKINDNFKNISVPEKWRGTFITHDSSPNFNKNMKQHALIFLIKVYKKLVGGNDVDALNDLIAEGLILGDRAIYEVSH